MMSHISKAYEYDVGIRIQNEGASASGAEIDAHEIHEGVVYEDVACELPHPGRPPAVNPAFGYRIDYAVGLSYCPAIHGSRKILSGTRRVSTYWYTRFSPRRLSSGQASRLLWRKKSSRIT